MSVRKSDHFPFPCMDILLALVLSATSMKQIHVDMSTGILSVCLNNAGVLKRQGLVTVLSLIITKSLQFVNI